MMQHDTKRTRSFAIRAILTISALLLVAAMPAMAQSSNSGGDYVCHPTGNGYNVNAGVGHEDHDDDFLYEGPEWFHPEGQWKQVAEEWCEDNAPDEPPTNDPQNPTAKVTVTEECDGVEVEIQAKGTSRAWVVTIDGTIVAGDKPYPGTLWLEDDQSFGEFYDDASLDDVLVEWYRSSQSTWVTDGHSKDVDTDWKTKRAQDCDEPGDPEVIASVSVLFQCDEISEVTIDANDTNRNWRIVASGDASNVLAGPFWLNPGESNTEDIGAGVDPFTVQWYHGDWGAQTGNWVDYTHEDYPDSWTEPDDCDTGGGEEGGGEEESVVQAQVQEQPEVLGEVLAFTGPSDALLVTLLAVGVTALAGGTTLVGRARRSNS